MDIRKKLINWLLKPDEEIRQKDKAMKEVEEIRQVNDKPINPEYEEIRKIISKTINTEPKPEIKGTTRKICPTIYGTDPHKGVIKKRDDGYYVYWYDGHKPRQKKGKFKDLKKQLDKFHQEGCTIESWNKNFPNMKKVRTNKERYISFHAGKYRLTKTVHGKQYSWGTYSSEQKAKIIRDYMEYKKWDLTYHPVKIVGSKKMLEDEYYRNMLPFIYGDAGYEKFKGGTLNDAY